MQEIWGLSSQMKTDVSNQCQENASKKCDKYVFLLLPDNIWNTYDKKAIWNARFGDNRKNLPPFHSSNKVR